jgi:N-acyl-L-homoserine lactone synthetase
MRTPNDAYLEKARRMRKTDVERLLSRARKKLMRRIEDQTMTVEEVVAIQLEIEDEDLAEWRERWAEIQTRTKAG